MDWASRDCRRIECRCTHSGACYAGWIDTTLRTDWGVTYDAVRPCPNCRPDRLPRPGEPRLRWIDRMRDQKVVGG